VITLSRRQAALLVLPLLAVLALAGSRLAQSGASTAPEAAAPLVADTSGGAQATTARLYVHVVGAVRRAGLYRLQDGSRVADAIRRAGGATARADVALVNLAAPLADGMQVVVPARAPAGGVGGAGSATAPAGKVSLAVATVDELDELPGIGPVTAEKIVDWRQTHGPFTSVDDLDAIPGIGPARIEQLRDLVTP
jgi:competence protein ComEA